MAMLLKLPFENCNNDLSRSNLKSSPKKIQRRSGRTASGPPRAAEFFAGIGMVRRALEDAGCRVVFANDIDPVKHKLYTANFEAEHFVLKDIRLLKGSEIPDVEIATASFPCTDLSLAGKRRGLKGKQSSTYWEFTRVLEEMGRRRPAAILIENVPSFATSHSGEDLYQAIAELNRIGYWCDLLVVDARYFLPQSRPRLFIIASTESLESPGDWTPSILRPEWIEEFVAEHPELKMNAHPLEIPFSGSRTLAEVVERPAPDAPTWWSESRVARFVESLSPLQAKRLQALRHCPTLAWATAYRRTRGGQAVWEIRPDALSGCLRTARGGSSKQAIVEAGNNTMRIRWMTGREYARLQGAPDYDFADASENQVMFGFGDAVCVPAVSWVIRNYVRPLAEGKLIQVHDETLSYA
jgi:DNA (cytosine-5)-methyltransferase 1